jgi:hypothetical protein
MEKPSCIDQLKDMVESLCDRDVDIKKCLTSIKKIVNDKNLSSEEIVIKIKDTYKSYGK